MDNQVTNEDRWLASELKGLVQDAKDAYGAKDPERTVALATLVGRLETIYNYFSIFLPAEPAKRPVADVHKPQSKVGRVVKSIIGGG